MTFKSFHITNYYHKDSGGISTAYNALLAAAERNRRHMRLIVPGEREEVEQLSEFTKIYYVPARPSPFIDKRYRLIMPWQYVPTNSILRKILLPEMPQMIEVRDKYTLSALGFVIRINMFRRLKRPMLVNYSSERMDDNIASFTSDGRVAKWFARRYMGNYIIPAYDFHVTNSPYTAEEYYLAAKSGNNPHRWDGFTKLSWRLMRSPRVPLEERIRISPSGVDASRFSPERKDAAARADILAGAGVPENAVVLLYAGRISPEKNVRLLPALMERLSAEREKEYFLLVAGGGPLADWLRQEGDTRCGGRIKLLGHLDKERLADTYANSDIFIHPNPREPFGIGPLEAMASGLPLVAPNSGGLLSYATNENAWLSDPTAEAFAASVIETSFHDELRARKTAEALKAVAANTREKAADNLLKTYDELYEDFQRRNPLYTDRQACKKFDYGPLIK